MSIVKAVIEKLKLKEVFAIIFIAALVITFLPDELADKIQIDEFRNVYQTYISLCIIAIGAYYLLGVFEWLRRFLLGKFNNAQKAAIQYMKRYISTDEMQLLIEKFYDEHNHAFHTTGYIDINDGRKAALESKNIIYRAASVSYYSSFAYNLQPCILEFLNKNLKEGNIEIKADAFSFKLK